MRVWLVEVLVGDYLEEILLVMGYKLEMSNRKAVVIGEMILDRSKNPISKSPVFKNLPTENKSNLYQSQVKRLKGLPKKSSVKCIQITSSNSINIAARESTSENRRKLGELLAHQHSNPYIQFNESLTNKRKQINLKDSNINSIIMKLDKKLESIQRSADIKSFEPYFEVFDNVIERDIMFGNILKKIRNGLKAVLEKYIEFDEKFKDLENKLSEKHPLMDKFLIKKRNDISLHNEIENELWTEDLEKKHQIEENKYISIPFYQWSEIHSKINEASEKIRRLEIENQEAKNEIEKIKEAEKTLLAYQDKETKFNLLLQALSDRGYPIQEIYSNDVLNLQTHLSNTNQSNYLTLKNDPHHFLSSDSSLASLPSNMDYL